MLRQKNNVITRFAIANRSNLLVNEHKDCFACGSLVTVKELLRLRLAGDEKTSITSLTLPKKSKLFCSYKHIFLLLQKTKACPKLPKNTKLF